MLCTGACQGTQRYRPNIGESLLMHYYATICYNIILLCFLYRSVTLSLFVPITTMYRSVTLSYDEGIRKQDIIVMIQKRFGIEVIPSTVSTWKKDRDKIRSVGIDKFTCKEIRVNPSQRARILIDMEYFLVMYILRQQDNSIPLTKQCITTQAGMLYTKLANTGIYTSKGCRINTLKDLTEETIEGF